MNCLLVARKALACALLLGLNNLAHGSVAEDEFIAQLADHAQRVKQVLLRLATEEGKEENAEIIRRTQIRFDVGLKLPAIANAYHEETREIVISTEFIRALLVYLPEISTVMTLPHRKQVGESHYRELAKVALTDVLLHEFGHHATNAFYSYKSSPFRIQLAEQTAEDWSVKTRRQLSIDEDNIGKLVALSTAFIAMQARYTEGESANGEAVQFLKMRFMQSCHMASSQAATYFCGSFDAAIESIIQEQPVPSGVD